MKSTTALVSTAAPAKHTPGPWTAKQPEGLAHFNINGDGLCIANVSGFVGSPTLHDRDGQGDANARLIAAAPDLLDAVRELAVALQHEAAIERKGLTTISWTALENARIAIAKATVSN